MKFQRFVFFTMFLLFSLGSVGVGVASDDDLSEGNADILIYSFSHGRETETREAQGVLKVGISSFDPVTRIEINGSEIPFKSDSRVELDYLYQLDHGRNEFTVVVGTNQGVREKRFVIYLGQKPKAKKPSFQFIGIGGYSTLDNVTSASNGSDKKSGSKSSITLVPMYRLYSGASSELKIKGILLREKFSAEAFAANEISYNKLAVEWKLDDTIIGDMKTEMGVNDIRTDNENPLLGEDETTLEYYISEMLGWKLGKQERLDSRLEYKLKDSKSETTDPDLDADGTVTELRVRYHTKILGVRGTGKLAYQVTDAKGKYKDSSTIKSGVKGKYTIDKRRSVGAGYDYKLKTMKISNPLYGDITPEERLSTFSMNFGLKIFKSGSVSFKMKFKRQESNVDTAEYGARETTLSYTHVF